MVSLAFSEHTCEFHPKRIAFSVCERCKRSICLEDKRILKNKFLGLDNISYHSYCPICNYIQEKKASLVWLYTGLLFVGYLIVATYLWQDPLLNFISVVFLIFFILTLKNSVSFYLNLKDLRAELNSFILKNNLEILSEKNEITCFKCGTVISNNYNYCLQCGFKTSNELIDDYGLLNLK